MIKNIEEFNTNLLAELQGRELPIVTPIGYKVEQMPFYFNIESEEEEYMTFKELVDSIELIVKNHPHIDRLDKIMDILSDFTLFQEITDNGKLVSAIVQHDSQVEDPIFGDIADMKWSEFLNDELVVAHLKSTQLILFDFEKGIALYLPEI